jgi:AcrR family transcriptional regulator
VVGPYGESTLGLRELKKKRTRATIVDVAARLCAQRGYENTTVDQIAAAADISPRTFSRYFHSKEAVIGALFEDTSEHVAEALLRQPRDITEHEALARAHIELFRAAERGEPEAMSFDRMSGFLRILNNSPLLGIASFTFRPDGPTRAVGEALARRMGVQVDDAAIRILLDTWAVLMATACGNAGSQAMGPGEVADQIEATYAVFTRLWRPWAVPDQPPAGGPER